MTLAKGKLITPLVAVLCFLADASSKEWARNNLPAMESRQFINGFLHFLLTANTGAAFSLGRGNFVATTAVAVAMSFAIAAWAIARERRHASLPTIERIGMGCLLGGALGNIFDRFVRHRVTDFLAFSFVSFPIFNVADVLIDVGIAFLIIGGFVAAQPKSAKEAPCQGGSHER